MSTDLDPGLWKQLNSWLWGLLLLPLGILWKKADGAVQKDELSKYAAEVKDVIKEHAANDEKVAERTRQSLIDIFERLEKQGNGIERIETTLTFIKGKR